MKSSAYASSPDTLLLLAIGVSIFVHVMLLSVQLDFSPEYREIEIPELIQIRLQPVPLPARNIETDIVSPNVSNTDISDKALKPDVRTEAADATPNMEIPFSEDNDRSPPVIDTQVIKQEIIKEYLHSAERVDKNLFTLQRAPPENTPEKNQELVRIIDKAATFPDCNTAYAGLSLLAIPFLIRDAFRDDGCRWQ